MAEYLESQGIKIKRGDGTTPTEAFTLIPHIMSFNGPGGQATVVDRTSLDSLAREKGMGLQDEGQFSFELAYDPKDEQHAGLLADRASRTLRNFEIELTDRDVTTKSKIAFSAYVLGFVIQGGVDADVRASVTCEISGAVTITAGS